MATTITAGSFSRLAVYEQCPHRAKLQYIDKIRELPRPDPGPGKEHANDRGSRVHDETEQYVLGNREDIPLESLNFKAELEHLKLLYKDGCVTTEQLWTFDDTWTPSNPEDKESIWLRVILDGMVFLDNETGIVIDYKTGKRFRNEVKHAQQGQLYMLSAFIRYPELQEVTVEFWYLDQDEIYQMTYSREQGMRFLKLWNNKMTKMTSDEIFPKKANTSSCRFCPYKTGEIWKKAMGTGDCNSNPC